jgi:MFS family permease
MPHSVRNKVIAALFIINLSITFAFGVNDSLFSIYLNELNANAILIGFAFAFYSISKISLSPIAGKLLDRFGAYNVLSTGLFIYLMISVGLILIKVPMCILALRIMQGAACAFFRPVMHYVLGLVTDNNKRGKAFGLFDLSFYIALASAPVFAGGIKEDYGFRGIFILALICSTLAVILINTLRHDLSGLHISIDQYYKKDKHDDARLKGLFIFIFFKGWAITSVVILLPLYMKSLNISETYIGVVLAVSTAFMAITIPFSGYLADKVRKDILIFTGGLIYSFGLMILFNSSSISSFLCVSAICGFAGGLSQPACSALLIKSSTKNSLGSVIGRFNFIMGTGSACGALVSSLFYYLRSEMYMAIWMAGALGILSAFVFISFYQKQAFKHETYSLKEHKLKELTNAISDNRI